MSSSRGPVPSSASLRPTPARRDTEAILSYYQSDLAGTEYIPPDLDPDDPALSPPRPALLERSSSTTSSSSTYSSPSTPSCYDSSLEGHPPTPGNDTCAPSSHRRRPSNISHPDADTRRMAIVHIDTPPFHSLSVDKNLGIQHSDNASADTLPSRHAFDHHLPHSHFTSPSTTLSVTMPDASTHHRSTSDLELPSPNEASRHRRSLKDISAEHRSQDNPRRDPLKESNSPLSSMTPIMPPPHRLNGHSSDRGSTPDTRDNRSLDPSQLSSYLYYQPGLHSTAGPLPPPPRAMFQIDVNTPAPPRPPRLRSPSPMVRSGLEELNTPISMSAVLPKKLSRSSLQRPNSAQSADGSLPTVTESPQGHALHRSESSSRHIREGAFAPSSITVTPPDQFEPPPSETVRLVGGNPGGPTDILDAKPSLTSAPATADILYVPPPPPELRRDPSWISVKIPGDSPEPTPEEESSSPVSTSLSPPPSSSSHAESFGIPRSKKEREAKRSSTSPAKGVLTDMKRYSSLPRTPSYPSDSTRFSKLPPPRPPPLKRKIRSQYPDAMWCKDVLGERTALDRAIGYAQKINELAMYDCGLSDWVLSVKDRGE
ncbi:hypothetical protein OF83DRAFT_1169169 [Amylostereum chailletii]|nr:hypothetical protein OF83DRAFT_1169169 [Amylostereum chailletii]